MGGDSQRMPVAARYLEAVGKAASAAKTAKEEASAARLEEVAGERIADKDEYGQELARPAMRHLFNRSKWLAILQRHDVKREGLPMRDDGFVLIDDVLAN